MGILLTNFKLLGTLCVPFRPYIRPEMLIFVQNTLEKLRFKDGRFGKVYVKQSLNGEQYTVEEIRWLVQNDSHMADRIVRFGEGLRETRQFWTRRRFELADMIRQLGSQGMGF